MRLASVRMASVRMFALARGNRFILAVTLLSLLITACQPQDGALPTLAVFDTTATSAPDATSDPLSAASITETPEPTTPPNTATPELVLGRFATDPDRLAHYNFVHAAPGTEPVDVYINSESLIFGLAFKLDTGRTPILSGTYTVRVIPRGGALETDVLTEGTMTIRPGETLFTVLIGTPGALGMQTFSENNAPLDPGRARLTFFHAVPRLPDSAPALNGEAIAPKIAFSQVSASLAVGVQSRAVSVGMQDEFQTFASRDMELRDRGSYTLIMAGDSADPDSLALMSYEVIVPQRVSLRVINVTENLGAVDVYLDSLLVGGNVDVTRASERVDSTTNARLISVYTAGADRATTAPLLSDIPFVVDATSPTHSLVVMGNADSLRVVAVPEDLSPIRPDFARFVFVNSLASVPVARVGGQSELFDDVPELQFGRFSQPSLFAQGTNRFFWQEIVGGSTGSIVERVDDFFVEAGRSYLYLLTGRQDGVAIAFSEPVTIDPALAFAPVDATPAEDDQRPRVRFINALDSAATINIIVDNTGTPIPLAYGQGSAITPLASEVFGVNVQEAATGLPLRVDTVTFQEPGTHTLVIYGDSFDVRFLTISDKKEETGNLVAGIRLINLTRDRRMFFGLRLGDPTDPTLGTIGGNPENWPTLPLGAVFVTQRVAGGSASGIIPSTAGTYDVQVFDLQRNLIAQHVRSFVLNPGMDYDLIAFEMLSNAPVPEIRAFVVPYPEQ